MISIQELELIARIILASICGLVIGYERQNRSKAAGVRTHCVVACAAALMMILSKYAYSDVIISEGVKLDPSRVAAGVASGVGFLGAGTILINKQTVAGLTTAAGLWATAGVGMAIGAGMYTVGVASAVIVLLIQVLLHLHSHSRNNTAVVNQAAPKHNAAELLAALEEYGVKIVKAEKTDEKEDGRELYTITAAVDDEEE